MTQGTIAGEGERSEPQPAIRAPSVEVPLKPERRRFDAAYKRRIIEAAGNCKGKGEIGALIRREGLYSSQLAKWRRQYAAGGIKALADDKRGRKAKEKNPLEAQLRKLQQENRRLQKQLRQAEIIIDIQKKVAAIVALSEEASQSVEPS